MIRSYRYRLYPNRAQEAALTDTLGSLCDLCNAGLQQRIEAWRRQGVGLGHVQQAGELKAVRAAVPDLAGYSFSAERQVLRRLDKAFAAFFRRVKRGETPGFSRFRAKSRFHSADFRVGDGLACRDGRLRLVGIPSLAKVRWHRELPERPKHAVISRSCGKWHVTLQFKVRDQVDPGQECTRPDVGIDVGLNSIVATGDGRTVKAPKHARKAQAKTRRLQRALAK
ncbi:MAG: transposase [Boseongicola sp.]|nr:transposase [Boseongicola sp.]